MVLFRGMWELDFMRVFLHVPCTLFGSHFYHFLDYSCVMDAKFEFSIYGIDTDYTYFRTSVHDSLIGTMV